jgi:hypothetical protein
MSWYIGVMAHVPTDARKFALIVTYTAAAQTDIPTCNGEAICQQPTERLVASFTKPTVT